MKILEQSRISPASGSLSPEILPLTFFDCQMMMVDPVQRVFFYDLPSSVPDFTQHRLPQLKLSLSLALREFRPLAGSVHQNSSDGGLEIRSSDVDSVPFTVAESEDDFYDLSGNHARNCNRFYPLVPPLAGGTGAEKPLLALQITLFPGVGVALGITISHGVADGTTAAHFLKMWSAACRLGTLGVPLGAPPSYDRSAIQDTTSLRNAISGKVEQFNEGVQENPLDLHDRKDIVRKTFCFSREQIKKMGEEFALKTGTTGCSSFVLTSGFMWACLVKAKGETDGKPEYFGFVFEARARLTPALPETYFGNCLGFAGGGAGMNELVGEEGVISAWRVIWKAVQNLKAGDALQVTEDWVRIFFTLSDAAVLTVAGSPRLGMYQVDFGWGRPRKVEVISIEKASALSTAEGGEDGRGVEIGIALPSQLMGSVSKIVADRLSGMYCQ